MSRSLRRAKLFAWTLMIALVVPVLAACTGAGQPAASPAPASVAPASPVTEASPEDEASPSPEAEDEASPSPEAEETPETNGATGTPPEAQESPINDKVFIAAFNQAPDTLFVAESQSSVTVNVTAALGDCVTQLSYDYQPTYCFDEFPTVENGGAISETVTIDASTISEESPIVVEGELVTDTALAEEAGIEIPSELPQLTVTYDLNPNLYWEDGEQVTADDAVESFRVNDDPELQLASRYVVDRIQSVEAGETPQQVVQTWVPGYVDGDYYVNFIGFVPEHIYGGQSVADIREAESTQPVSFGPYIVQEHIPAESTTLVSNPYFAEQPNIGTVIYRYLADADQLLAQLETGEIDYAGTIGLGLNQIELLEDLEAAGTATVQTVPATVWEHLDFGIQRGDGEPSLFDDVRIRQAVAYGINRQSIIDNVLFGRTEVMNTYVPADHPSYPGDDALEAYEFDPERAQELLEEAGVTDADGNGIREKDGRPFSFTIYTTQGNTLRQATLEIVQQNLRDIGLDAQLEFVDGPSQLFLNGADGILSGRRFDMALYAWVSGVDASHLLYRSDQIPTEENGFAGQNNPGYSNPEFDAAATRALSEFSRERRVEELDQEPLVIFNRDLPAFPLYQRLNVGAFDPGVTGIQLDPTSDVDLYNIQEIDIEQE